MDKTLKKEVIFYSIMVAILIIISVLNNVFWKIGKEKEEKEELQQLKVNNITYDVPFEEKWLD